MPVIHFTSSVLREIAAIADRQPDQKCTLMLDDSRLTDRLVVLSASGLVKLQTFSKDFDGEWRPVAA